MATEQSTVDFILDQLVSLDNVSARKMFGEYALYCGGKVVGLICDDTLYIKITEQGKIFAGAYYQEGNAYKGAKISMMIEEGRIEDREWLSELVRITAQNLSLSKKKITDERIYARTPTSGKTGVSISKAKYDQIKTAIISVFKKHETLTFSELLSEVEKYLQRKFDGSISWYTTTVKLDLEANNIIERIPGSKPQLLRLKINI